jgi:hypothetical protein
MEHVIAHQLDLAAARGIADRAFAEYSTRFARYTPTLRWVTEHRGEASFTAAGYTLTGSIEIAENKITLNLDVPLLLRPFKKIAVDIVDREVKRWLDQASST